MTKCPTCGKVAEQSNKPTICRGCGDVMLLMTKIGSTVKQSEPNVDANAVSAAIGQAFMGGGARIIRPVKKKVKREVENGD